MTFDSTYGSQARHLLRVTLSASEASDADGLASLAAPGPDAGEGERGGPGAAPAPWSAEGGGAEGKPADGAAGAEEAAAADGPLGCASRPARGLHDRVACACELVTGFLRSYRAPLAAARGPGDGSAVALAGCEPLMTQLAQLCRFGASAGRGELGSTMLLGCAASPSVDLLAAVLALRGLAPGCAAEHGVQLGVEALGPLLPSGEAGGGGPWAPRLGTVPDAGGGALRPGGARLPALTVPQRPQQGARAADEAHGKGASAAAADGEAGDSGAAHAADAEAPLGDPPEGSGKKKKKKKKKKGKHKGSKVVPV